MQDSDDCKYKFTIGKLEKCSYRYLQQKAKSLRLPSNYKKIYLIQLIHTKYFGSPEQVKSIIEHVRRERQQLSQTPEISSTSEDPLRLSPDTPKRTPIVIRYSPKVRRKVIRPDYHEPQPLGKPRAFDLKTKQNINTTFANPPQPSCSNISTSFKPMPALGYKAYNPKSSKPTSYKMNPIKQYSPNTTLARVKSYFVEKKPETDRVLRNRTFPVANRHKPEKYKDKPDEPSRASERNKDNIRDVKIVAQEYKVTTSNLNTVCERYKDNAHNLNTVCERYKDNAHNLNSGSERYKDNTLNFNTVSERYRDNACNLNALSERYINNARNLNTVLERYKDDASVMNSTMMSLLQSRKPSLESQLKLAAVRNQHSVPSSLSLTRHQPSILVNDPAKLVQRSIERARVNRKLDDNFESCRDVVRTVARPSVPLLPVRTSGKRQRKLSGIYPIEQEEPKPKLTYHYIQSGLGIRNADGTFSKINALVRKPVQKSITGPNLHKTPMKTYKSPKQIQTECIVIDDDESPMESPEYNFQDVFANTISIAHNAQNNFVNTVTYTQTSTPLQTYSVAQPNCSIETPISNERESFFNDEDFTTYCHKKIRAEQVRSRRESAIGRKEMQRDEHLPRIHEVFSSFNNVMENGVSKPIFVQVGDEGGKYPGTNQYEARTGHSSTMLEALYNLRSEYVPGTPLPAITTTGNTECVYSTPVLTTAVAQTSNFAPNAQFHLSHDYQSEGLANDYPNNIYSYLRHSSDNSHSTTGSLEMLASQVEDINSSRTVSLTAGESIPDMVEDALELISQDGDYMERIEMDVTTQCVLCHWAGPRALLENHILQEHADETSQVWGGACRVSLPLPALALARGVCRVLRGGAGLLLLRAACRGDWLCARLQSLAQDEDRFEVATLTVYNKATGEPHSWTGLIPPLTPDDPPQGLRVKLSQLDLDTSQPMDHVYVSFHVRL